MQKTIAPLLFVSLFSNCLFSQYQELKKNDNITWIAEFEMELSFDINQSGENSNEVSLLKFLANGKKSMGESGNWLPIYLYDHLVKGEVLAYKTSSLESLYTLEELLSQTMAIDTVITFDPETSEEQIQVVKSELSPWSMQTCQTRQAIYFNIKTQALETCLIAIAPQIQVKDTNGNAISKRPLAWIKMEDLFGKNIDLNSQAVTWAASTITMATPLELSKLTVAKGGLDLRKYLSNDALSSSFMIESDRGYGSEDYLTQDEKMNVYGVKLDTVITFDPMTYKEEIQIFKNEYKPSDITHCRLVQDWFYVPEKRLLTNRLKAVAPLIDKKGENGESIYLRPMYYIKY